MPFIDLMLLTQWVLIITGPWLAISITWNAIAITRDIRLREYATKLAIGMASRELAINPAKSLNCSGVAGVYLIQSVVGGPIKIGYSQDIGNRLAYLQTGSPEQLQVIAIAKNAAPTIETALHSKFDRWRLHGEWFQPTPQLVELALRLRQPQPESSVWNSAL